MVNANWDRNLEIIYTCNLNMTMNAIDELVDNLLNPFDGQNVRKGAKYKLVFL